jgi:DNA-damage-inducible protein J
MTDCVIRSRIDPLVKEKAVAVFQRMGLTLSEAIRLFIYQSVAEERIPFSINIPNALTSATLLAIEESKDLEKTSLDQLAKDWGDMHEK